MIPVLTSIKKDESVFKLAKANQNEVRMTQFLLSCMRTIYSSFDYLTPDVKLKRVN